MKNNTANQILRISLALGFLVFAAHLWAQGIPRKAKIALVSFDSRKDWNPATTSGLKQALEETGWVQIVDFENSPDFVFFIRHADTNTLHSDLTVFSVAFMQSLPAPWLDELAKEEISYKLMPAFRNKKLPKNGKFVREYVTREMWKEYRYLLDLRTYAFKKREAPTYWKQVASDGLAAVSRVYRVQK
ncbi:MAG: hypothetical protein GXO76_14375 [Calditrichaeota bacterium]|nr:hypothetical protein [Calditrichota bacterium]